MMEEPDNPAKAALDALGVIPNVYFDIIARIVPGMVLVFGINRVFPDHNVVLAIYEVLIPKEIDKVRESSAAWFLILVSTGYIVGHFLSPFVRFLEEGPQWVDPVRREFEKLGEYSGKPADERSSVGKPLLARHPVVRWLLQLVCPPFWRSPEASAKRRGVLQEKYNSLRFHFPAAAALAIRIRAEYTMYGGFAVAIAFILIVAVADEIKRHIHETSCLSLAASVKGDFVSHSIQGALFLLGIFAVPVMLFRHLHTWKRFRNTVDQLVDAS